MNICVFGASSTKLEKEYYSAAHRLGELIADAGHTLVFGGGRDGMMGHCAEGAASKGGHIIGIAPKFFDEPGILYKTSGELIFTDTMDERKQRMNELSDAFIALPGGIGTFDEFFGCLTLKQLGRHSKPIILLNTKSYFGTLDSLIRHSIITGFTGGDCAGLYRTCELPEEAMEYIRTYRPVSGSTKRICEYSK